MSDLEEDDAVPELLPTDSPGTDVIQEMLEKQKHLNPTKFASCWEMDEEDIDEATEEEKQNNPVVRILWAAETGKADIVNEMLNRNASLVNATDSDGYTPLHRAAYEGHAAIVELLLDQGAQINAGSIDGWTALHSATYWGQTDAVDVLIRRGASINACTNGGQTPLHLAAAAPNGGSIGVIQLLLTNEFIDVSVRNRIGETAHEVAKRSCRYHAMFDVADDAINVLCKSNASNVSNNIT